MRYACSQGVVGRERLPCVKDVGPFTTFPVDPALQKTIHRPKTDAAIRKKHLVFEAFSAISEKCQVER